MDSAAAEPLRDAVLAERHLLERSVIGEHGYRDAAACHGVARALGTRGAGRDQRVGLGRGAIEHAQLESRGGEVGRHRLAHRAQSDKSDFRVHPGTRSFLKLSISKVELTISIRTLDRAFGAAKPQRALLLTRA